MARCPDCNRFVSYEDPPEVEIENDSVDLVDENTGLFSVAVQVRVVLKCADCGTELKETSGDVYIKFEHKCEEKDFAGTDDLEITSCDGDGTSRQETTDKKGKPIKPRYRKTFYGAEISLNVVCEKCSEEISDDATFEEQASCFDELT